MKSLFLAAVVVLGAACSVTEPKERQIVLGVAADSVACNGAHGPMKCLSVRELVGGDAWGSWQPHFDGIEGFAHEPGFNYEIMVARRHIANPPADGSSIADRLLLVLQKTPATGN